MLIKDNWQLRRLASRLHSSNMLTAVESTSATHARSIIRSPLLNNATPCAATVTTLSMVIDPSTPSCPSSFRTTSATLDASGNHQLVDAFLSAATRERFFSTRVL